METRLFRRSYVGHPRTTIPLRSAAPRDWLYCRQVGLLLRGCRRGRRHGVLGHRSRPTDLGQRRRPRVGAASIGGRDDTSGPADDGTPTRFGWGCRSSGRRSPDNRARRAATRHSAYVVRSLTRPASRCCATATASPTALARGSADSNSAWRRGPRRRGPRWAGAASVAARLPRCLYREGARTAAAELPRDGVLSRAARAPEGRAGWPLRPLGGPLRHSRHDHLREFSAILHGTPFASRRAATPEHRASDPVSRDRSDADRIRGLYPALTRRVYTCRSATGALVVHSGAPVIPLQPIAPDLFAVTRIAIRSPSRLRRAVIILDPATAQ